MCRIAGVIAVNLQQHEISSRVKLMCQAQKHGGPDDEGLFEDENTRLAFGHRRLSIIDLSSNGHQPMTDDKQQAWITFNGEIYNYLQLKTELTSLGRQFITHTDTEVILQAYLQWGTSAFIRLKGMFAFAVYDVKKKITYLVRDTAGIKPIYYITRDKELSFASEIKAFKQSGMSLQEDENWKIRFLAFGHIPEPFTTLKGVFSLPKGCFLQWDHASAKYNINSYQQKYTGQYIDDVGTAQQQLRSTLITGVSRQLISDAPIGVFLSGGIDSSLLALLAYQQKQESLKTISIYFDEKSHDERNYQHIISNKLRCESFSHLVKQKDFEAFLPNILSDMDMPTTDGINSWFISKYAHEDGLKAVLSGIGADELFGGYPSFNRIKYLRYLRKLNPAIFRRVGNFMPDQYKKINFLAIDHPMADYLLLRGLFSPMDIAELLDLDIHYVYNILFYTTAGPDAGFTDKERASWFETNMYMQNQLLRDTDVMSMSHGLEVRVPFLDEDFTRTVQSIKSSIRFTDHPAKKILINSFKELLPPAIWNRPKMGFTFPLQTWMREHKEISDTKFYKDGKTQSFINKFKNNQIHWSKAFALYQIQANA